MPSHRGPKMRPAGLFSVCVLLNAVASPALAGDDGMADFSATSNPDKNGYSLLNPTPDALLRAFAPDRPPKANSAYTVDAGHFQIETDLVNYSFANFLGVSTHFYQALDPVWKVGLTNWADFELQFNGYQNATLRDTATGAVVAHGFGFGDVLLRTKINVFGNDGGNAALAVIPYVKLPSSTPVISNGVVENGVIAPLALTLPQDFSATLQTEFDALKDADDSRRHANFSNLANISHGVPGIDNLSAVIEIFAAVGTDRATPSIYTFDTALTYTIGKNIQIDAGMDFGLNKAAPREQIFAGISARF
jgi:Putative MetA-pathway of phenol degradation